MRLRVWFGAVMSDEPYSTSEYFPDHAIVRVKRGEGLLVFRVRTRGQIRAHEFDKLANRTGREQQTVDQSEAIRRFSIRSVIITAGPADKGRGYSLNDYS